MFFRALLWLVFITSLHAEPPFHLPSQAEFEHRFTDHILRWAQMNTGSKNLQGLEKLARLLSAQFRGMKFNTHWDLRTRSLTAEHRVANPKLRILLVAHLDTVFEPHHPFRNVAERTDPIDGKILTGPGVADDKGGIALIIETIRALQNSPAYSSIDWKIFIAADEEITSVHSKDSLLKFARDRELSLVFEPGWWDAELKAPRIPSTVGGNALIEWNVKGIEAHSGIAYEKGRSAVLALAEHIQTFESWSRPKENFLVNVAAIEGGGKLNVRPGQASMKVSVRYETTEDEKKLQKLVEEAKAQFQKDGILIDSHLEFRWHPQILASPQLIESLRSTARRIGQPEPIPSLSMARSASAILSEAGYPTLDSLGPYGSGFHSDRERVVISSAYPRLNLICQFLLERVGGI